MNPRFIYRGAIRALGGRQVQKRGNRLWLKRNGCFCGGSYEVAVFPLYRITYGG